MIIITFRRTRASEARSAATTVRHGVLTIRYAEETSCESEGELESGQRGRWLLSSGELLDPCVPESARTRYQRSPTAWAPISGGILGAAERTRVMLDILKSCRDLY